MFGSTRFLQIDIKLFGPRRPALCSPERAVHKKLCITSPSVISTKQSRYQQDSLSAEKAIALIAARSDILREDSRTLLISEQGGERDIDRLKRRNSPSLFLSLFLLLFLPWMADALIWRYFAINSRIYSSKWLQESPSTFICLPYIPPVRRPRLHLGHVGL